MYIWEVGEDVTGEVGEDVTCEFGEYNYTGGW